MQDRLQRGGDKHTPSVAEVQDASGFRRPGLHSSVLFRRDGKRDDVSTSGTAEGFVLRVVGDAVSGLLRVAVSTSLSVGAERACATDADLDGGRRPAAFGAVVAPS